MKTRCQLLFIGAAIWSGAALAGIRVENVTRDVATQVQKGNTQTMLVQDGMVRTNASANGAIIVKGSTIIVVDDKRHQYREMTKEDLKKLAAQASDAVAKMQQKMQSMSPEQRAMMEKMMGNRIPGGLGAADKPDTWDSKDLGTTAMVEGRRCHNWILMRNGAPFQDLCVVPYETLPGKEDARKVFKELAEAFGDLAKSMPGSDHAAKARAAINGYPARTRLYGADGQPRGTETVLTKWVEESIPASTFEVPAGYTKAELPTLPN
jgi:hypothetical protein